MTTPQRYTKGVTTADQGETLGQFVLPDPTKTYGYFNDFFQYAATDWVLSTVEAGAGSATEAISDTATGGGLLLTNAAGSGDHDFLQLSKDGGTNDSETFLFSTGKKAWFKTRFQVSDGDKTVVFAGLYIVNTDPQNAAPTDGVYFKSNLGVVSFIEVKNSVSTTESAIATVGDATDIDLGYYWDGVDTISIFVNDVFKASVASGTLPDDENLAVSFGVENGEAVADTMLIDYIGAWMER